ncbi:unnamed protein product [Urochloa decumbens]|uniref:Transcription factor n=1 Tax=Urochloa decumbens TaxID=240449 RepID=A0ABC8ZUG7_9POAL
MDQLLWPASFCGPPPSPASSFFSGVGNYQYPSALDDSQSCNVPEQWLAGKHDMTRRSPWTMLAPARRRRRRRGGRDASPGPAAPVPRSATWRPSGCGGTGSTACSVTSAPPCPRCPGWTGRPSSPTPSHTVAAARRTAAASQSSSSHHYPLLGSSGQESSVALEARMIGPVAAALRLTTAGGERHAPARLMAALRALDLPVQHACVCRFGGATVQDVVVEVPLPSAGLRGEGRLRAAVLHGLALQESG